MGKRIVRPAKPKLDHLVLLKQMCETNATGLCTASGVGRGDSLSLFYPDPLKRLSGSSDWCRRHIHRQNGMVGDFYNWGWTNRYEKPEWDDERKRSGIFAWYEHPYVMNKNGRAYWNETGEALYTEMKAKQDAERAAVERLVIVGPKNGRHKDGRKACVLVRVIRETKARYYVEIVSHHSSGNEYFSMWEYVQGDSNKGTNYVNRDQVFLDDVTEDKFWAIVETEDSIVLEKNAMKKAMEEEISMIRQNYAARTKQREAEWESQMSVHLPVDEDIDMEEVNT